MQILAPLFITIASVAQTGQLEPIPMISAVRVSNCTDTPIRVRHRLPGDRWKHEIIGATNSLFIYAELARAQFNFDYFDGSRWHSFTLPAAAAIPVSLRPARPDVKRRDEAAPYYFTKIRGTLDLFAGYDPAMTQGAAAAALARLGACGTRLELFKSQIDIRATEPLVSLAEFGEIRAVLSQQFKATLKAPEAPDMDLVWERSATNTFNAVPRIMIYRCDSEIGATFLADLVELVLKQVPGEFANRAAQVCRSDGSITLRGARLNHKYLRDDGVDVGGIRDDIVNHLRKNSIISAGSELLVQDGEYYLRSEWHRIKTNSESPIYFWRMVVVFSVYSEGDDTGVRLRGDVQAAKQFSSSGNLQVLTKLAVGQLPNLPPTVWKDDQSNVGSKEVTSAVSPVARLCRDVENGLERILVHSESPP